MVAQEITYLIEDKNQTIVLESLESKETLETNVYLLSRSLATVEGLAGDNIKLTVKDNVFDGFKKQFGQ